MALALKEHHRFSGCNLSDPQNRRQTRIKCDICGDEFYEDETIVVIDDEKMIHQHHISGEYSFQEALDLICPF